MSYTPTARAGSLRRQHHGGDGVGAGFGQVTIASESVPQIDRDAAIAALATPSTSSAAPTTSAYLTSGASKGSSAVSLTAPKDSTAAFATSTMPGWYQASQVATAQSSNAPIYIAIGGAIVLLGIIIVASRRPARSTANARRRKRARRRRS